MSDTKYWLGFSLVPEIGPRRLAHLLNEFGDLKEAWDATERQLQQSGLEKQPLQNLLKTRAQLDLDEELERVHQIGAWVLTAQDSRYPDLLKNLSDAPLVLYVLGTITAEDNLALGIVGTRKATQYGRDAAYGLAKALAANGITVVSGLAQGIDTAAHRGALDGQGRTIAVMGCGINQIYPRENYDLAREISYQGAIISEFPLNVRPEARNFPRRNRVISGLALGILVAEAPEASGALITAGIAAEQGREVFAVPGNIFSPNSRGTNRLIQDGAKLVMSVEDILEELNIAQVAMQTKAVTNHIAPTNDLERQVVSNLSADPIHVDDLARLCGLPIARITATLTILELKGLAQKAGPMRYCLIHTS
ncbi:MAG: DNA-processing protein DprA [Anaerolineae bacterium]|nr:DNA-processing protein DprA [Anaerolineae bacterium]